jgi:hypothetical protein
MGKTESRKAIAATKGAITSKSMRQVEEDTLENGFKTVVMDYDYTLCQPAQQKTWVFPT